MMKRWLIIMVLIGMMDSTGLQALAMENHSDVLRDQHGNALGGATVRVYNSGSTTLATIYSDNGATVKSNPFLTDALTGRYNFYATNGVYDITFTYQSATFDANHTKRIALFDVNDSSGGGGGGGGVASCYRLVTASSYTVGSGDNGCLIDFNGSSDIAVTLPQATTSGFGSSFRFTALNRGDFTVTITPTTSTIQGDPSLILNPATSTDIASDGTNYFYTPGISNNSGWPTNASPKAVTWANSYVNALQIGDGTDYWAIYRDPVTGLQLNPVCSGAENGCNIVRKLAAGKYWEIQNSSGISIFRVTNDTTALTNILLDAEASATVIQLPEETFWDTAGCQAGVAQLVWNVPSTNAPAAACDTGTNTNKAYASFDAATDESFETDWVLPTGFTGTIDVHFVWKAAATTGSVGWCAQLIRVADGSTSDPSYPAQSNTTCVSDAAKGTTLQENHVSILNVSCASCVARDHVYVRISRDANGSAVTDDMSGDAHLMKFGRTWRVAK